MNRSSLLPLGAVATAVASLCFVSPAHAAGSHAKIGLEAKVQAQIVRTDSALTRVEQARPTRRLDADVRTDVTASIEADQSALANLAADLHTADTMAQVRAIGAEVADYRASVYTQVVTDLHRADQLATKVEDSRRTLGLDLSVQAVLNSVHVSLAASMDDALSLDATSDQSDVHAVSVDLHSEAHAYAQAMN